MSNIKIEWKNQAKFEKVMKEAPKELGKVLQLALQQTAGETIGKVKQHIKSGTNMYRPPVKTGIMGREVSIIETKPLRITISPNLDVTPYALFVHEGTSKMPARPFMTITKEQEEKKIQEFFKKTLDGFVNELARRIG